MVTGKTVKDPADFEDNKRVDECDIADALGMSGTDTRNVESVWIDGRQYSGASALATVQGLGHLTKSPTTINAQDTDSYVGGQGTELRVYDLGDGTCRVVMVNTYLAQVTAVTPAKEDTGGHWTKRSVTFTVYQNDSSSSCTVTRDLVTEDFAQGDYALVQIVKPDSLAKTSTGSKIDNAKLAPPPPTAPWAAGTAQMIRP